MDHGSGESETVELDGGRLSRARRVGDTVLRNPLSDPTTAHRFLKHLHSAGFHLIPEPLGVHRDGTEQLSFIEGRAPQPPYSPEQISDEALVNVAMVVRQFHDASLDFEWPSHGHWPGYDIVRPAHFDCIGHNDLTPWNFVFEGSAVRGIIDWDACGPSSRVWDFAYTVHHFVPFHADHELEAWGWTSVPNRYERLRLMIDAYGADLMSMSEMLDATILRLASLGAYLAHRARLGDPAFAVQTREDHASAYFVASARVVAMRKEFLAR